MSSVDPTRHDYRDQAARYDRTRGASPSILGPLERAIAGAPGPTLLDVAGGTGNYAEAVRDRGMRPCVVDLSEHMLEFAQAKGLPAVRGDAARLPFADASFDSVMSVSALHLIPRWREVLAESRRVLRPGGRLGLTVYTRENLDVHWIFEYFPSAREWVYPEHQPLDELTAELPGARAEPLEFEDLVDASMAALCRHPRLLLDPEWWLQTSFFERLRSSNPTLLADGLLRLKRDLDGGRHPDLEVEELRHRHGDGTIIAWQAPLNE